MLPGAIFYLLVDYAIWKRVEKNYYGDTVVFNGISKALGETRKEYTEKGHTKKFRYPGWIKWTFIDYRRCKLTIKLGNESLALDAIPFKRRDGYPASKMRITIPKSDYCELKSKVRIKMASGSSYKAFKVVAVYDKYENELEVPVERYRNALREG